MSLPTRATRQNSDPFQAFTRDFDALNRFFSGAHNDSNRPAPYGVDVREDGDALVVEAELPGFTKEQVDITLENRTLTISAQRNGEQKEPKSGTYLLNERRYSRFQRSFTLPSTVDDKTVQAKLENGVLTVTLNRREETKPRKISVG